MNCFFLSNSQFVNNTWWFFSYGLGDICLLISQISGEIINELLLTTFNMLVELYKCQLVVNVFKWFKENGKIIFWCSYWLLICELAKSFGNLFRQMYRKYVPFIVCSYLIWSFFWPYVFCSLIFQFLASWGKYQPVSTI